MIVPDEKDWTWVLHRPCGECGFDASTTSAADVAGLVRGNAAAWQALLRGGLVSPGRPNDATWSSLEYASHVRDVYRRYLGRLELMLDEDDPMFLNWDQDASALEDACDEQEPAQVVGELADAAEGLASRLDRVENQQWERPGRRSDGASFTVDSIARYMVHDTIHHVWDVERIAGTTSR